MPFVTSCSWPWDYTNAYSGLLSLLWGFFYISISRWSSTRGWVTVSLLKSPDLFSVFWRILIILLFGWSPLVLLFPRPPVQLSILWWLYRAHQLLLVSPSLSCSIFFQFSSKVLIFLVIYCHFYPVINRDGQVHDSAGSLLFVDYQGVWSSGRD